MVNEIEYLEAKSILNKVKWGDDWFGNDFMMNLYRGCNHNCIYCYSRAQWYGIDNFTKVCPKKNAIEILEKQAKGKRKKGIVGLGAMTDTYNYLDKDLQYTRKALQILDRYGFGASIETKSCLVERDIDVLKSIHEKSGAIIKISITTADDELGKRIEPGAPKVSERFATMKKLSDAGLYVGTCLLPIIPYITDDPENIKEIIRLSAENGASFVHSMQFLTLTDRQRVYFYEQLDRKFPGLKERYIKEFGKKTNIYPHEKELEQVIIEECQKYGLRYEMSDIVAGYKMIEYGESKADQLTLEV